MAVKCSSEWSSRLRLSNERIIRHADNINSTQPPPEVHHVTLRNVTTVSDALANNKLLWSASACAGVTGCH